MKNLSNSDKNAAHSQENAKFVEGIDFYFENGLMVLTAHFLEKRGYCCGNGCQNCPYPKDEKPDTPRRQIPKD